MIRTICGRSSGRRVRAQFYHRFTASFATPYVIPLLHPYHSRLIMYNALTRVQYPPPHTSCTTLPSFPSSLYVLPHDLARVRAPLHLFPIGTLIPPRYPLPFSPSSHLFRCSAYRPPPHITIFPTTYHNTYILRLPPYSPPLILFVVLQYTFPFFANFSCFAAPIARYPFAFHSAHLHLPVWLFHCYALTSTLYSYSIVIGTPSLHINRMGRSNNVDQDI